MSGAPAIQVEGLGKRYRLTHRKRYGSMRESIMALMRGGWRRKGHEEFWALRDVSFTVKAGEAVGLIGRNGAGKSTLLKLLSRITQPTTGRATIHGRVGSLLEVGAGFHHELTGRENIFLGGAMLGMRRDEIRRRFDEIVAFAEVERFLDTPVKHFSSGMYMRLAFAVAAHLDTEILLVDEVLAVGDAQFQRKCLGRMSAVSGSGRTVIFVSHNLGAVKQICPSAMIIAHGRITHAGPTGEMIDRYLEEERTTTRWQRTGDSHDNQWFTPLALTVVDGDGNPVAMPCANDRDLWLAIDAEIGHLNSALTVGYTLTSAEGHLLYWSYQTDGSEGEWPVLRTGRQRLLGRIPRRLLNQGSYRITLLGSLHFQEWLFPPDGDGPSITLEIAGGLSDSPLWTQRRPGLLAPVLEWKAAQPGDPGHA